MNETPQASRTDAGIVLYLTILGLAVRLAAPLTSQFPLNDGGLFYTMATDLIANGLRLPLATTYNNAQIPFVYPPLALYFTAILSKLTDTDVLNIIRILPPVFSGLAIPAYYLLAREIATSKLQAILAVLSFAFIPRVFEWHVTGGGITRAPGFIFAILTMTFVLRLYKDSSRKNILLSSLFAGLTLLTHPEAAIHTILSAAIFFLWTNRSAKGMKDSLAIAVGAIALSAPWWLSILLRLGTPPFQAAVLAVGADSPNLLVRIFVGFLFVFTDEPYLTLTAVFALIGIFTSTVRREYFPIVWMFTLYILEPRGGALYMMLPFSLLSGLGLVSIFSNIVPALSAPGETPTILQIFPHQTARWMFAVFFVYLLMSAFSTGERLRNDFSLQPSDAKTLYWIRESLPASASFAMVTGETTPFRDPWSEWLPAITGRKSLAGIFGYEWVNDGKFEERLLWYITLQACARRDETCLSTWEKDNNLDFTHLYLQLDETTLPLQISLSNSTHYNLVHITDTSAIYEQIE